MKIFKEIHTYHVDAPVAERLCGKKCASDSYIVWPQKPNYVWHTYTHMY